MLKGCPEERGSGVKIAAGHCSFTSQTYLTRVYMELGENKSYHIILRRRMLSNLRYRADSRCQMLILLAEKISKQHQRMESNRERWPQSVPGAQNLTASPAREGTGQWPETPTPAQKHRPHTFSQPTAPWVQSERMPLQAFSIISNKMTFLSPSPFQFIKPFHIFM